MPREKGMEGGPKKRVDETLTLRSSTNFYIWYFRTCPKCPPAHKERFQVDIRGFSIE